MRDVLVIIRRLAVGAFALSVLAVPLGAILLIISLSPDMGDNELGDAIGFGLGVGLLVLGAAANPPSPVSWPSRSSCPGCSSSWVRRRRTMAPRG
jgi:hypothetical protein